MMSFTEQCVALFLMMAFSFMMVSPAELSTQEPSDVKDSVNLKKPVLPYNLSSPDVNLADFLPMDATPGTTPDVCPADASCAFQYFARVRGVLEFYRPYIYCDCPEGQDCTQIGVNNRRCFFYYGCRNRTQDASSTTEAGIRNASVSQLSVSTTSMAPQNAATEPGQPVTFKFEGEIPVSSNC